MNGDEIVYELLIHSKKVISAEEIESACAFQASLHEAFADYLFEKFGGYQVITAKHGKVEIKTTRGDL